MIRLQLRLTSPSILILVRLFIEQRDKILNQQSHIKYIHRNQRVTYSDAVTMQSSSTIYCSTIVLSTQYRVHP